MGIELLRTGHSREVKRRGAGIGKKNDKVPELNNRVGHEDRAAQVPEERRILQYFWASLVAQLVKNLPAMWETWI